MTNPPVRLASAEDRDVWNDFVDHHPAATYSHWFEWQIVFRRAYKKSCLYLFSQEGGGWTGVLPLVHMKGRLGGDRLVSLPFLDLGGIVATSTDSARALQSAALGLLRDRRARSLDLRGGEFVGTTSEAPRTSRYRFLLALPRSEESLWKSLGSKVRNQIRKSQKEGLDTSEAPLSELPRFYEVFARNMHDLGSPVHSKALFAEILAVFGPSARLYLTRNGEGQAIGGGIALRFKQTVVVPWASSLRSARPACPNHSLYWRVLRDAVAEGAREFDFGRSSEGTGTYRFKKQWGALPEALEWCSLDPAGRFQPERHLSSHRNARLAVMWRRLPLGFANLFGPWIRGRLPN